MTIPEQPDSKQLFEQIVLNLWNDGEGCNVPFIEAQLTELWNARGAADQEAIAPALEYLGKLAKAKEPPDVLAQIRTLDR